ncbi:hypothetical protein F5887DRAFT_476182 [Amanita rubescens]|nr:hypothetical protein F5887DRAFT_476182 [Amanita rubescens]
MSVASRAPVEILSEIFLFLRDKPIALHDLTNSVHFGEFPWAVGQVCSRWRSIFLSYPALWSSLSLYDHICWKPPPSVAYVAEMNRRTAFYLKRSKQHPLTITVQASNSIFSTIWITLLSHSNRWQKVDLWIGSGPNGWSVMDGLAGRRGKIQILKSLKITLTESKGQRGPMALEIAPCLTEIELDLPRWPGARINECIFPCSGYKFPV